MQTVGRRVPSRSDEQRVRPTSAGADEQRERSVTGGDPARTRNTKYGRHVDATKPHASKGGWLSTISVRVGPLLSRPDAYLLANDAKPGLRAACGTERVGTTLAWCCGPKPSLLSSGVTMLDMTDEASVFRPDGISYLRIPAPDPSKAARFYAAVFDWEIDPDAGRFTDGSGHVIGHFVSDINVADGDGVRPYVYVADVEQTLAKLTSLGGSTVTPPYPEGNLKVATFRDPAGNVIGVWQQATQ